MSWIIPYRSGDFKWKDYNRYLIIDIRDEVSFNSGHIPFAINESPLTLYSESQIQIPDMKTYYDLKAKTELDTPGANIVPFYTDIEFTCGDEPITQDVLVRPCKPDLTFFKMSVVTTSYDFQGKIPVIVSNTCEESIQTALGVMRATWAPVIVIRGGMIEWVASGLPVI